MRLVTFVGALLIAATFLVRASSKTTEPQAQAPASTTVAAFKVSGMTCGGCEAAFRLAANRIAGVTQVTVSHKTGRAEVTYDPSRTNPSAIAAAISDSSGLHVVLASDSTKQSESAKKAVSLNPSTVEQLRAQFNESVDKPRVVTILSPMCPACQAGQGIVGRVFSEVQNDRLRGFVIWLSMKPGDSLESARAQATNFDDARVSQGWDASGSIGDAFAKTLALKGRAWDIYAVYAAGVKWDGPTPPKPTFWMHQLTEGAGADQSLCLNPAVLLKEVKRIAR